MTQISTNAMGATSLPSTMKPQPLSAENVELGRLIGSGQQGSVYSARIKGSKRKCVVKKIFPGWSPEDKAKARGEAEVMQRFWAHSNIVRLLGCYEDADSLCLVLEACTGGSLDDLLHRERSKRSSQATKLEPLSEEMILHWCDWDVVTTCNQHAAGVEASPRYAHYPSL
eukprot:1191549-Prorocentrum_minimum.AAC.3